MTTIEKVKPVRKQIVIEAPQAPRVPVFTDGIDIVVAATTPRGCVPMARSVIEPRFGGRW